MPTKKSLSAKSLLDQLSKHVEGSSHKVWEGTLKDYIGIVLKNKNIHMSAHARILNMIESHGVKRDDDGEITSYNFFSDDLFGINNQIEKIMSYLRAAAAGSEVSRRILLLYGPTSSGKSQLAILLKKGLEDYSKTEEIINKIIQKRSFCFLSVSIIYYC